MMKCFCYITSFLFLLSCSNKNEIPPDIISQEKFVEVLADVQVVEAIAGLKNRIEDTTDESIFSMYATVFTKNNITQQDFEKSFDFYANHPDLIHDIYEKVQNELKKRMDSYRYNSNITPSDSAQRIVPTKKVSDAME